MTFLRAHPIFVTVSGILILISGCAAPRPNPAEVAATVTAGGALSPEEFRRLQMVAQASQAYFERFRRSRMQMMSPLGTFRCIERIGRFCVDRTIGGIARLSYSEHSDISTERQRLIEDLQLVSELIPDDPWVVGQWVRYLVDARRFDEAIRVASDCQATPAWWCAALQGYAYHYAAAPERADAAFSVALARMPDPERRVWLDLAPILEPDVAEFYATLDANERSDFEDRFWFLADPLFTRPGNEVRSQHFARRVQRQFEFDSHSTEGSPWGEDLTELLLRYGLPSAWFRGQGAILYAHDVRRQLSEPIPEQLPEERLGLAEMGRGLIPADGETELRSVMDLPDGGAGVVAPPFGMRDIVTQYSIAPQSLLPPRSALLDSDTSGAEWDRIEPLPHTGYAIPLGDTFAQWLTPLASQVARFHRGDSTVVVAGYDLSAHGIADSISVDAGLALLAAGDSSRDPVLQLRDASALSGALEAMIPSDSALISLEVVAPEMNVLARVRREVDLSPPAPNTVAISDLLLLEGEAPLPDSLSDAVSVARGSTRVRPGEPIGIYWEFYNLDPTVAQEISMTLTLHEPSSGGLRGFAERLGVVEGPVPLRTSWLESVEGGSYVARSVGLQIPDVSEGLYTLELTADVPGHETISVRRELDVTDSTIRPPSPGTMIRRPDLTRPTTCWGWSVIFPPRCVFTDVDPSWFGHEGGISHLGLYGYD